MRTKEAILKVLEDNKEALTYKEVLKKINEKGYKNWDNSKTPSDTIAAVLGDFIRQKDKRVKRIKGSKNLFEYYYSKHEKDLNLSFTVKKNNNKTKNYFERDLHKLLSSYLKNQNIFSKTIFHEKSKNTIEHQKWIHPDMIGIDFLNLKDKSSNALMRMINKADAFNLTSYEIKKEIKSDYELKKYFFQAVSNSSWANYGYLVAFDISKNLIDEMERLNQSFGIGIIELKSKPYESDVLFLSKYRELDFKTIDKLCIANEDFKNFIINTESILIADERYLTATQKQFEEFCDNYFVNDSEIKKYCLDKNIPSFEEEN